MSRIFEPCFTTKPKGEGTGLGLSVVHGIVNRHESFIRVFSREGVGTTFEVCLPLPAAEVRVEDKILTALPRGRGERILVVDDEPEIVKIHQKLLEQLGYEVTTETDSTFALELFRRHPDSYKVILTDQIMPKLTGLTLAEEVLKIRPDIPVILCTGYGDRISAARVREHGVRGLLSKPVAMQELAGMLARLTKPAQSEPETKPSR